ncbi:uncharacterized protein [Rutidosis leptorrhynchoides]|uniref:uncharacterized protein n=1 Tax=Rutidosis leptorrhynchoides TaxID=125765 RepID=UPI003A997BAC
MALPIENPTAQASQRTYSYLPELQIGKEAEVKIMICRSWDTHTAYGKYLSTDFIASDEKKDINYISGNLLWTDMKYLLILVLLKVANIYENDIITKSCLCYGNMIVEVVGIGECGDCKESNIKSSHALSGLKVTVDCKLDNGKFKTRGVGELDGEGNFKISLPKEILKDGKLTQECYAQLHNAANSPCTLHDDVNKIIFLSKSDEKHTFGPLQKLKFSSAVCTSAFFWPAFNYPALPPLKQWPKPLPMFTFPPKYPFVKPIPPPVYNPPVVKPPPPPIYTPTPNYNPPPKPPVVEPTPTPTPPVPISKPKPAVYKPPHVHKPKPKPKPPVVKPEPQPPTYKTPPVPKCDTKPKPVYKPKPKPKPHAHKLPPVPVYKPKPKPKPPVYKPAPVPVYKPKPKPPVYKPAPVPVYNPEPKPPVYSPGPVPVYNPTPKQQLPQPIPIYKPIPPFYKKPCPPFAIPKLPPFPTIPPKYLNHPIIGDLPPLPPKFSYP